MKFGWARSGHANLSFLTFIYHFSHFSHLFTICYHFSLFTYIFLLFITIFLLIYFYYSFLLLNFEIYYFNSSSIIYRKRCPLTPCLTYMSHPLHFTIPSIFSITYTASNNPIFTGLTRH